MWILPIELAHQMVPRRFRACLFLPTIFESSTHTNIHTHFYDAYTSIPILILFRHPSSNNTPSNFRSHNNPAGISPYKCLSNGATGYGILSHDFGHRERGRRIQIFGQGVHIPRTADVFFSSTQSSLATPLPTSPRKRAHRGQFSGQRFVDNAVVHSQTPELR